MKTNFGIQNKANPGRELEKTFKSSTYLRFPIKTPLVKIDENLDDYLKTYTLPYFKKNDIFCISTKIISITKGFYVKESDLKISWLAKFLVRFVKKWPDDPGYAVPAKIQLAMNIVGKPRFLFAVFVGGFLKLIGFPGWFYRIAGHNINAIDGFIPELYADELKGYGFVVPDDPDAIADEIEDKHGMPTALLDGNNVDTHILGMSKKLKAIFSKEDLSEILEGNPQGQDDGTPMLLVREK